MFCRSPKNVGLYPDYPQTSLQQQESETRQKKVSYKSSYVCVVCSWQFENFGLFHSVSVSPGERSFAIISSFHLSIDRAACLSLASLSSLTVPCSLRVTQERSGSAELRRAAYRAHCESCQLRLASTDVHTQTLFHPSRTFSAGGV